MAEEIVVKLKLDSDVQQKMTKASAAVKTGANKMKSSTENAASGFRQLATAAAAFFGARALIGFMKESVRLADIQAKSEAALTTALGKHSKALLNQASALQKVTLFGDEETIAAQARLAAFVKEEDQLMKLTPLVQDFATAKGMDLAGAAELVGKTLGSSTNALTRYGVEVEGAVGTNERLNDVLEGLQRQVGGAASAAAEAGAGPIKQFQNSMGDAREEIGAALIPALNDLIQNVGDFSGAARVVGQSIGFVISGMVGVFKTAVTGIQQMVSWISTGLGTVMSYIPGLKVAGEALKEFGKIADETAKKTAEGALAAFGAAGRAFENTDTESPIKKSVDSIKELIPAVEGLTDADAAWIDQQWEKNEIIGKNLKDEIEGLDLKINKTKEAMAQIDEENEKMKAQNALRLQMAGNAAGIIKNLASINKSASKENFAVYKAAAYAEAVISTAGNVIKALGQPPFPGTNLLAAGLAGALGATQLAAITAEQGPKFARGGIVPGSDVSGDQVLARVNSGEMILNQRQQANLFSMANGGGVGRSSINVGGDTIIINGNADESTVAAIQITRENQLNDLREMMIELGSAGQMPGVNA